MAEELSIVHPLLYEQDHHLTRELLAGTADLIATPARWTKRALARDRRGAPVMPGDARACRYCLLGAMLRVAEDQFGAEVSYGRDPAQCDPGDDFVLRGDVRLACSFNAVGFLSVTLFALEPTAVSESGVELAFGDPPVARFLSFPRCLALFNDNRHVRHADVSRFVGRTIRAIDLLDRATTSRTSGAEREEAE